MIKLLYPALFITALATVSCAVREPDTFEDRSPGNVFFARIESPDDTQTKVYADNRLMVLWDEDDAVSVFDHYTFNLEYRFTGKTGDNSGTFRMVPFEEFATGNALDLVYAVYPHSGETRIDNDGVLSVTLPARQTYRENSFGPGANTMVSCTSGKELMFKNLCGYLQIRLYGEDISVSSLSLKGNGGEPLAGKAQVFASTDNPPTLTFDGTATGEITLEMENPVRLGASAADAVSFWFVVPPVTFQRGFTVTVKDQTGHSYKKTTAKSIRIERNTLARMSAFQWGGEGGGESPEGSYVDEYGVDYGPGVTIDGTTWAPVNCGYKPATADSKGYPYGKLYQWGRKYGQGYGAPYYNSSDPYEDETTPSIQSFWTGKNEDADKDIFYYGNSGFNYNWITTDENFWNSGTEDSPQKNGLYDPCPEGWRVPTEAELSALFGGHRSELTTLDGVHGVWASGSREYSDDLTERVFMPAAGGRWADNWYHYNGAVGRGDSWSYWSSGNRDNGGVNGGEWGNPVFGSTYKAFGFAVRCCKEGSTPTTPDTDVTSVTLSRTSLSLTVGETQTLVATVLPGSAADKTVTWSSDNPSVATVDDGTVTAVSAGTATITVTTRDGGHTATCAVTVSDTESDITSKIRVSISSVDVSGGSMSFIDSFVVLTAGVKLGVRISNDSSQAVRITGFRLICGRTGAAYTYSLGADLAGGATNGYQLTIPATVYSPIAEFTYQYDSRTYTASAQYTGGFN